MSQQVYDLIQSDETARTAYAAADDQAVVDRLNDSAVVVHENHTRLTATDMMSRYDPAESSQVLGTLQSSSDPLVKGAYDSLTGNGLDMAHPLTQAQIDLVGAAGGWDQALIDKVKAEGITRESLANQSLGRDATLADVAAARSYKEAAVVIAAIYNDTLAAIESGTVTAIDDAAVRAAIGI